jgi:YfiH family protein
MIRRELDGTPYYTFETFNNYAEIISAVFTRLGGVSRPPFHELNVGHSVGDEPSAVNTNHRLINETLGLSDEQVVTGHQVHGNGVARVTSHDGGQVIPATDALITHTPGVSLMLRFADCLPIFLYDPERRIIGLAHAGWRGTAARVAQRLAAAMVASVGSDPGNMIAALGPAIGPCCYEIGAEVAESLRVSLGESQGAVRLSGGDSFYFDLWEANRQQLEWAGVREIEISHMCTACHTDEFFSHRAETGRTGRFAAVMGIRESK